MNAVVLSRRMDVAVLSRRTDAVVISKECCRCFNVLYKNGY
jgi:hypothetical protein